MRLTIQAFVLAGAVAAAAGADARQLYDDLFFVRPDATAADLFKDRADCRTQVQQMGDSAAFYSNPEYGALSAMGSALDEDALHEGGLHKRMQQAVFVQCMRTKGWTEADVSTSDARLLQRANLRHPAALDAWLKAHAPAPASAPAPTVKTTAAAVSTAPGATAIQTPALKAAN